MPSRRRAARADAPHAPPISRRAGRGLFRRSQFPKVAFRRAGARGSHSMITMRRPGAAASQNFAERFGFGNDGLRHYGIFAEQHRDQHSRGDGDHRADNPGQRSPKQQRDDDGETGEVDAVAHDAGREVGGLDLGVYGVKDEYAGYASPGIDGSNHDHQRHGDDRAGDGDEVEEAHEHAERVGVSNVQEKEDDHAAEAEDQHERSLAKKPLAHADFGAGESSVETLALIHGKEGKQPVVSGVALKHEVNGEDNAGDDVKEHGGPGFDGKEDIAGEVGGEVLQPGVERGYVDVFGERQILDARQHLRSANGQFIYKLAHVTNDRGKG